MSRPRPLRRPRTTIGRKIAAQAANAMPAEANDRIESPDATQCEDANTSPTTVGIVLWKTIAPVMLPIARVSLPWRTHRTLLNFSGSSVAIGAMTRARSASSAPRLWAMSSTAPTNA